MKEIGGYFGLEKYSGRPYHTKALELNSARGGLLYLIKARRIKKLYIPRYICGSVVDTCNGECEYAFYPISDDFQPILNRRPNINEYVYIVNYYGRLTDATIKQFKEYYGNIIVDNVQAFFRKPIVNVDTLYSCRKFFGVPDGAYLYTDAILNEVLMQDYSASRIGHLIGRLEHTASEYYPIFKKNDESLKSEGVKVMSKLTKNLLCGIDYDYVRRKRNENYTLLAKELDDLNSLKPMPIDGPFAYPLYCKNGPEARRILAKKKIYIPMYWPDMPDGPSDPVGSDYASNILPLPCDQRYCAEEIKIVVENVKELLQK